MDLGYGYQYFKSLSLYIYIYIYLIYIYIIYIYIYNIYTYMKHTYIYTWNVHDHSTLWLAGKQKLRKYELVSLSFDNSSYIWCAFLIASILVFLNVFMSVKSWIYIFAHIFYENDLLCYFVFGRNTAPTKKNQNCRKYWYKNIQCKVISKFKQVPVFKVSFFWDVYFAIDYLNFVQYGQLITNFASKGNFICFAILQVINYQLCF